MENEEREERKRIIRAAREQEERELGERREETSGEQAERAFIQTHLILRDQKRADLVRRIAKDIIRENSLAIIAAGQTIGRHISMGIIIGAIIIAFAILVTGRWYHFLGA